jgi:hypothetical protein
VFGFLLYFVLRTLYFPRSGLLAVADLAAHPPFFPAYLTAACPPLSARHALLSLSSLANSVFSAKHAL